MYVLLLNQKSCVLAFLCFGLVACTTQDAANSPPAEPQKIARKATDNASVFFESDYGYDTAFSVNAANVVGNQCSDFSPVQYADKATADTAKTGKPKAVMIQSASNLPVAITAHHHVEKKGLYSSCGPLTRVFVPEAKASYVAKLVKERDQAGSRQETGLCVLEIKKIDEKTSKRNQIKTMSFSQCTR